MKEKLQGILQTAKEQLAAAKDSRALDEARSAGVAPSELHDMLDLLMED